jgi:uncharacterized cupredoxin-like copper-binding protein
MDRRATARGLPLVAAGVAVTLVLGSVALAAAQAAAPVEVAIRYSRFVPGTIHAVAGRPLEIVLRNDDPIDHEWIVGDADVHARHRTGTEPVHAARPTEVSVPAGESRTTLVTFDRPGTYRFICHLPGHEAYGMVGEVVVAP